jgi:hypothetical protein
MAETFPKMAANVLQNGRNFPANGGNIPENCGIFLQQESSRHVQD